MKKTTKLSEYSMADLVALSLHFRSYSVTFLSEEQHFLVRKEIEKRIKKIDFKK